MRHPVNKADFHYRLVRGNKDLIYWVSSKVSEHIHETLQPQLGGTQPITDLKSS